MEDERLLLLLHCLSVTHTHEHPSSSQTHPAAPHTVAYTLDQTHTKSQWAIFIWFSLFSLSLFFCLCNLSLYKWRQAGSQYLEQRRQKKVVVCHGSSRRRSRSNIGKHETWGSSEFLLFSYFRSDFWRWRCWRLGEGRVWALKEEKKSDTDL